MERYVMRRDWLRTAATGGTILGLGDISFLAKLPSVLAAETRRVPGAVQIKPDMSRSFNSLRTPRAEPLLEEVSSRIRRGLSYRESWPRCYWRACGTSSHGPRWASSSMPCWPSTRSTWQVFRPPRASACCRSSGPWIISRTPRPATRARGGGG